MKKIMILFSTLLLSFPVFATQFKAIYDFQGGSDGSDPGGLVVGKDGALYGVTPFGGNTNNCNGQGGGTIFKVSRGGTKTILYNFTGGSDGCGPGYALTMDSAGNFYGTTGAGGRNSVCNNFGCGTIFKITPKGVLTTLYAFQGPPSDVYDVAGSLTLDAQGNLYGVGYGGENSCGSDLGCGAVFEFSAQGAESILYNFTGAPDGMLPLGPSALLDGVLYGTTMAGGDSSCGFDGCGVFYSLNLNNDSESVLYTFEESGGVFPTGLIADSQGNFYGSTSQGGTYGQNAGVLFKFAPGQEGWTESVLYNFGGSSDAYTPTAGLLLDQAGNLYGTAANSNHAYAAGAVFKISPSGHETILHNFPVVKDNGRMPGGGNPSSGVVTYDNGVLYGTTSRGGDYQVCSKGCGVVFRVER
jgi:uncharacterized repeat protein (TIGR03803 family)